MRSLVVPFDESTEYVEVGVKKLQDQKKSKPRITQRFYPVARCTHGVHFMDFAVVLQELSAYSNATWALGKLMFNVDNTTNICKLPRKTLNAADLAKFKRGLPVLLEHDYVRRIGNGLYMLNPQLFLSIGPQEDIHAMWDDPSLYKKKR